MEAPSLRTGGCTVPVFLDRTMELKRWICGLSGEQLKKLWACSDKIVKINTKRFEEMDLSGDAAPAIDTYTGVQYTALNTSAGTPGSMDYLQEHLRILSGFYGVLKPRDGIVPYRLSMNAALAPEGCRNLYAFWGEDLYREVMDDTRVIIGLASAEYARCVEKYLSPGDRYVSCVFGEKENGKVVPKNVYSKIARGTMAAYLAETGAEEPEQMRSFDKLGYRLDEVLSTEDRYVFSR